MKILNTSDFGFEFEFLSGEYQKPEQYEKQVESHVDSYGIRRCSKTLMPIESDGVGVEIKNIRDTIG